VCHASSPFELTKGGVLPAAQPTPPTTPTCRHYIKPSFKNKHLVFFTMKNFGHVLQVT
jgi:hypothetical protein